MVCLFVLVCACLLLFNAVVCFVFYVWCDVVCCVCVSRVFVHALGLIVCVLFVMYAVMSYVLYCVCFVIGCLFSCGALGLCVCVCFVLAWFRCDFVRGAARFAVVCVCVVSLCACLFSVCVWCL